MVDKLPKRGVNVIGIGRARIPSARILIPHLLGGHVRSQVEKPAVRVVSKCVVRRKTDRAFRARGSGDGGRETLCLNGSSSRQTSSPVRAFEFQNPLVRQPAPCHCDCETTSGIAMLRVTGKGSIGNCDGVGRRDFLQVGTLGALGFSLSQWSQLAALGATQAAPTEKAKACILIFNLGAPSQLDLFDLKPDAPREIRGPFKVIRTRSDAFELSELLPLHAKPVSYTHLRAHETPEHLVCRLLLEKKKQ